MKKIITDANSIVAKISHKVTEYSSIYPITPSSTMGEEYSKLSEKGETNIFGEVPQVDVMQSETGAIASSSGALFGGLYSTTFSSSQGLLLMIPNMYKMASSLKPFVLNVASRSLSTHALNIFCDHSDIYSTLSTGFCTICSSNVQKSQDFCMISHMLTLKSQIPVLHFFDGFITSHNTSTIDELKDENIKNLFPTNEFLKFKNSCLVSTKPKTLGTNQNPDIYFQNRERVEEYVQKVPEILNECFEKFYNETKRKYQIFEYFGSKKATKIIVSLGSSVETLKNTLNYLDDDYGVVGVNLLNPFCDKEFLKVLPKTAKIITVLDRSKQAGNNCEYLAKSVVASLKNSKIEVLCGRYGLGGKNFDLNMSKAVFMNMNETKKDHFTIGIEDDITKTSILYNQNEIFEDNIKKYAFYGIGNDGSVGASKLFAKLIGNADSVFVNSNSYYDSKKSGNLTESQVFVSTKKFELCYKEKFFDYIVISNSNLINNYDILSSIKKNSVILINSDGNFEDNLNDQNKFLLATKRCKIYFIDADKIALQNNLGNKTNIIMLASFINLIDEKNKEIILQNLKTESAKLYGKDANYINDISNYIKKFVCPDSWKDLKVQLIHTDKSNLPVSKFSANGEFKNINTFACLNSEKAFWLENKCIKCTNCSQICPHSAISIKQVKTESLINAPDDFKFIKNSNGTSFCLFINKNKCTGCGNCVNICPTKALILKKYLNTNKDFFDKLDTITEDKGTKNLAYFQNYYSCNSSCTGCMEIMYYKLLGSLFGSHLNIINATGCSSIYNGGIDCSPFKTDSKGFGTSFVSNLFEDNAEFGYGITYGYNASRENFIKTIKQNIALFSEKFKQNLQKFLEDENNFTLCQQIYENLSLETPQNKLDNEVKQNVQFLIPMTNFIVGGDGWAYDIDFGGLDHIISLNKNVNILILDNEVYSNTGGQTSKATNLGAKTKYTQEKQTPKKDLFLSLFQYKNLYFSKVNFMANKNQCIKSFVDAVNHEGPSVILAYCPCLNHKIEMSNSIVQAQNATKSGYFNLITYKNGILTQDSEPNFNLLENFILSEGRYKSISNKTLTKLIESKKEEFDFYKKLTEILK